MNFMAVLKDRLHRYGFYCFANSIEVCQLLKDNIHDKGVLKLCYGLISPYLLISWGIRELADYTIGQINILFEKKITFKDQLSIVAIAKNEGPYICLLYTSDAADD